MNHFDSSDSYQEGFRSGAAVVGYDRGAGIAADGPVSPANEAQPAGGEFDPKMSYGQTRSAFEAEFEQRYVSWLLSRHGGNISAAAREARMDRKHLHDLAKKHNLRSRAALHR